MSEALRKLGSCGSLEEEYWFHVSDQEGLPLATAIDRNTAFADLNVFANGFASVTPDDPVDFLAKALLTKPSLVDELRVLTGISNKRLYLELSYLFSRILLDGDDTSTLAGETPSNLTRKQLSVFINMLSVARGEKRALQAAKVIAKRLLQNGLLETLSIYADLSPDKRKRLVDSLILPKEAQQNEAKRRGHGVEALLATSLRFLGVAFEPAGKIEAPMGSYDPNVSKHRFEKVEGRTAGETWSFDLLILQESVVRVCVQGLIQSSDPGQFGVNKIDESIAIRSQMDELNVELKHDKNVQLWGLVDGVGYAENKTGTINKLLKCLHQFIQVNSLYKAACALHKAGLCDIAAIRLNSTFYSQKSAAEMSSRYVPRDIRLLRDKDKPDSSWREHQAGFATLFVK